MCIYIYIYNELGFDISLRSFCTDSSSPQIYATLFGHVYRENGTLRKHIRSTSARVARTNVKTLARKIP